MPKPIPPAATPEIEIVFAPAAPEMTVPDPTPEQTDEEGERLLAEQRRDAKPLTPQNLQKPLKPLSRRK